MKQFTKKDYAILGGCVVIACAAIIYNQNLQNSQNTIYFSKPLTPDDLAKYSNSDNNAVIIYPTFTYNAYKAGGFYDYYKGICNTCDSVSINTIVNATYITGLSGFAYLRQLNYSYITDIDVDKNPDILKKYDKLILLHNEYMTKTEFNAIKNHPHVIYLYPNSAYTEISVDYSTMKEYLVKGHGYDISKTPHYPVKSGDAASNGFGYFTSSNYEYDFNCNNWRWEALQNGIQPTCWPEFLIKSDRSMLQTIKDFPEISPITISPNLTKSDINIPYCDYTGKCSENAPIGFYRIPIITKPDFVKLNDTETNLMLSSLARYHKLSQVSESLHEDTRTLVVNLWHSTAYDFDSHCSTASTEGLISLILICKINDDMFLFKPYPNQSVKFLNQEFINSNCIINNEYYQCYINSTKIHIPRLSF